MYVHMNECHAHILPIILLFHYILPCYLLSLSLCFICSNMNFSQVYFLVVSFFGFLTCCITHILFLTSPQLLTFSCRILWKVWQFNAPPVLMMSPPGPDAETLPACGCWKCTFPYFFQNNSSLSKPGYLCACPSPHSTIINAVVVLSEHTSTCVFPLRLLQQKLISLQNSNMSSIFKI